MARVPKREQDQRLINTLPLPIREAFLAGKPFCIAEDGSVTPVELSTKLDRRLKELQLAVGGYITLIPCIISGWAMFVDEEGLLRGRASNIVATRLYTHAGIGRDLTGPAVLVPERKR